MKKIILKKSQVKRLLDQIANQEEAKIKLDKSTKNFHKLLLMSLTARRKS